MKMLVMNSEEVEKLLPMSECIEVMAEALGALARGESIQPLRTALVPPKVRGVLGLMPSYRGGDAARYGLKAVCVFPDNPAKGLDSHQGGVLLFSGETGELLAVMNASAITAIRTAAVSAVATRLLAREDAGELAIIGAGVQARSHIEALACVRLIKRARVVARNFDHAQHLAGEMQPQFSFPIEAVRKNEDAVRGADLIVTATSSLEPVINKDWISAGAHINAIGTHSPSSREVDSGTMAASLIFVDRRESALNESGDYILAANEGVVTPESILGEIGELLIGTKTGRTSSSEITLFKSLGLAIEDVACADYLYRKAQAENAGSWVEF